MESYQNSDFFFMGDTRLLIVESNDLDYFTIDKMLLHTGIKLFRAVTGKEAINMCAKNIDIMLINMVIPHIDSITISNYIKRLRPNLPIIAYSLDTVESVQNSLITPAFNNIIILRQKEQLINELLKHIAYKHQLV